MYRFLLVSIILFVGCQKESSSNIKDSEIEVSIIDRALKDSIIVSNNIFEISYNEIFEQPNWVKYQVRDIEKNADRDGMNFFKVDSIHTSDDNDYYNNRWDRGHMAPAGSFNDSYSNLLATFSYLNVALQYDDLNRGAWVDLEEKVREWAETLGTIEVEINLEFNSDHITLDTGAHFTISLFALHCQPFSFFSFISFYDIFKLSRRVKKFYCTRRKYTYRC